MRELAVEGANDINVTADRTAINNELDQLNEEIIRIKDTTAFNTKNILDASAGTAKIQVGANASQTMDIDFSTVGIDLTAAVVVKVDTSTDAQAAQANQ